MRRLFIITLSLLYSCLSLAKSDYQIDLIIFAQPSTELKNSEPLDDTALIPISRNSITLNKNLEKTTKPYYLLPASYSSLKDQYYLLSHKSHYQILGHYSWRQTTNNQTKVALAPVEHNGWRLQGTFQVLQSAYYSFNANLQVSSPKNPKSYFSLSQKQRLKENIVYYLDNERIGMLVKIHQLS